MIEILILSVIGTCLCFMMTLRYRCSLLKMVRNDESVRMNLLNENVSENDIKFYIGMADLYDFYRVKFSIRDLLFRPSSSRENSASFYLVISAILAWWAFNGLPSIVVISAIAIATIAHEYISYWRDTFFRTVESPAYQNSLRELYDHYKPSNRLG